MNEGTARGDPAVERAEEALYALPPDEFIAARNALAGRLRDAGERAAADEIRSLRKPSVAAWAVNQLVRGSAKVGELVETSAELRRVQTEGGAGAQDAVRRLARHRHALVADLTDEAARVLESAGLPRSRSQLERVTNTLLALTSDEQGEVRLRRGRLARDEAPTGFGGALGSSAVVEAAVTQSRSVEARRRRKALLKQAAEAQREAERLELAARQAEDAAARARAAADLARSRAADALSAAEKAGDTE